MGIGRKCKDNINMADFVRVHFVHFDFKAKAA
jgi:hypothetical protein